MREAGAGQGAGAIGSPRHARFRRRTRSRILRRAAPRRTLDETKSDPPAYSSRIRKGRNFRVDGRHVRRLRGDCDNDGEERLSTGGRGRKWTSLPSIERKNRAPPLRREGGAITGCHGLLSIRPISGSWREWTRESEEKETSRRRIRAYRSFRRRRGGGGATPLVSVRGNLSGSNDTIRAFPPSPGSPAISRRVRIFPPAPQSTEE